MIDCTARIYIGAMIDKQLDEPGFSLVYCRQEAVAPYLSPLALAFATFSKSNPEIPA
jgi:hypothetical protein